MSMGWHEVNYNYTEERSCQCGKGKIIQTKHVYEESEMFPFERFTSTFKPTCPSNCEDILG